MQYNLHPILVHFPIAFLFLYSFIKILPVAKWIPSVAWRDIERVLLVCGVAGAFFASATGEMAGSLVRVDQNIKEAHESFALATEWLYGILLIGEALSILNKRFIQKINWATLAKITTFFEKLICHKNFSKLIAGIAFVALFVTGLLGGAMVYGDTADPLVPVVLRILGIN